jgi:hypothetical protein
MNTPPLTTIQENNAPWNETLNPMMQFDVEVTQTLSKDDVVGTEDYDYQVLGLDEALEPIEDIDTSSVDWEEEWKKQHYGIPSLLRLLEDYVIDEVNGKTRKYHSKGFLMHILRECKGWVVDETHVEKG